MEFKKTINLFDTTSDVIKKWIEVYNQSMRNYNVNKSIRIKTRMLRADLCYYSDPYIVIKVVIAVTNPDNAKRNKSVAIKNNIPFINHISKINAVQVDNAEDLDVAMPMYNLFEYSKNYKKQQVVFGIITEMNQVILFLLILNLLNAIQVLQEILVILAMVKLIMMQTRSVKMKLKLLFR